MCHGRARGRPSRGRHERPRWHEPYDAHRNGHLASGRGEEARFKEDGSETNQGDAGQAVGGASEIGTGVSDADDRNRDEVGVKIGCQDLGEQDEGEDDDAGQTRRNHEAYGDGPDDFGTRRSQADPRDTRENRADRSGAHAGIGWEDVAFGERRRSKDEQAWRQAWQGRHVDQPPL